MLKLLEGITVVEMGTYVAVPKAARMLADWGADVIKVESPGGDDWRVVGQSFSVPYDEGFNPIFQSENANKRAVALNLKSDNGKAAMHKLLEKADVFMTNTRPASLERLGLDYESIKDKYPGLICLYFSGYGDLGPEKDRPGFDIAAFWAKGGALQDFAVAESQPSRPNPGFGDSCVSPSLAAGILAALIRKMRTGEGDKLKASLYGTNLFYYSNGVVMGNEQFGQHYPESRYEQKSPLSNLYKTKDGDWFMFTGMNYERRSKEVLRILDLHEYVDDERFYTLEGARKNMRYVVEIFEEAFAKLTSEEVSKRFSSIDFVHEKLNTCTNVPKDAQAWANDYLREVTFQDGRSAVVPNNPIQFESGEAATELAPRVGEDTKEVLKSLGYTDAELEAMAKNDEICML
ncbi:MAG: CaiB/BaiF CoA transferase family protein [Oscillospiraceae bacterium]